MSKDFEYQAKKEGDSFRLQPREQVWTRIEEALDEKKRRRVAWWWWGLPLMLLLGAGLAYLYAPSSNTSATVAVSIPASTSNEKTTLEQEQPATATNDAQKETASKEIDQAKGLQPPTAGKKPLKKETFRGLDQPQTNTNSNTRTLSNPKKTATTSNRDYADSQLNTNEPLQVVNEAAPVISAEQVLPQASVSTNTAPPVTTGVHIQTEAESKSETTATAEQKTEVLPVGADSIATTAMVNSGVVKQNPATKKSVWYVQAGIGMAKMGSFDFVAIDKASASDPLQNSGGSGFNNSSPKDDKAGVALSVDLQRRQMLGKRWQWNASLGWQYQQVKQYTGRRVDSVINITAGSNFTNNFYYDPGSNYLKKGSNHRIILSNEFSWQVLKKQPGLRLSAGIYTGLNFGNNYLIEDYLQRQVKNDNLYKTWFVGLTPGMEYVFKNNWTIGAYGHFDLTQAYQKLNTDARYWRSWEIKAGIPIFSK